jgi:hypothetical protein
MHAVLLLVFTQKHHTQATHCYDQMSVKNWRHDHPIIHHSCQHSYEARGTCIWVYICVFGEGCGVTTEYGGVWQQEASDTPSFRIQTNGLVLGPYHTHT